MAHAHIHGFRGKNGRCYVKSCGLTRAQVEDPNRLEIGSSLFLYLSENYGRQGRGGKMEPLWAKHIITEESPTHWTTGTGWGKNKINKKTLQSRRERGMGSHQWFTEAGKIDKEWESDHLPRIQSALHAASVDELRAIAKIIGYKEEK